MKKIILVCMAAFFTMLPCVSVTSKTEKAQPEAVKVEQKASSCFDNAESLLVKREPQTTELEGTWKSENTEKVIYLKFSGRQFNMIEYESENKYYEYKGTFRIKKDGSVTLLLSKFCEVVDGVSKAIYDLSEYKWITGIPDKVTANSYSVDGDALTLETAIYSRYTDEIDWRIK